MKRKILKTGDANKKRIAAILYSILAFIVAGLSLGLYFVFRDNSKSSETVQISDVNVQSVAYTDDQKKNINKSIKELLGLDEIDESEIEGFNERELLQYNIKCGVAESAADVFAKNNIPTTSIDAIVDYLSNEDNQIKESTLIDSMSILDAFTYTPENEIVIENVSSDKLSITNNSTSGVTKTKEEVTDGTNVIRINKEVSYVYVKTEGNEKFYTITYAPGELLNIDVVGLLDIGTEYFNYVQNLRKFVNKGSEGKDPLMTDDQVIDVIMDLINVALDTRKENDEAFKIQNNKDLAAYIDELAKVKLAWDEIYSNYFCDKLTRDVNQKIKEYANEAASHNYAWTFYTGEDCYANFLSENRLSDDANLKAEWDKLVAAIKARSEAENDLIKASLYATENYLFNKAEEGFNEEESTIKKLTKFGIKLEKAVLKMTSFLNTTQLKDMLSEIYNGETSEEDLITFFYSNANAMRNAVADTNGQVITVSEELYNELYDLQYEIDDVYSALYVLSKINKQATNINQICNLLGVVKDTLSVVIEGIEDVENIINGAYDSITGLMTTLGKEDGPTTVVYNIVDAFLNDCAYNRGITSKTIEDEEIEFTGSELINVLTRSGQVPLALIEIVDGLFGDLGADLTRTEIQRVIELVFYGIGTVNGIMGIEEGFNFMEYINQIKTGIVDVNENKQEEIEMYTGIVKSVLDVFGDVIDFKEFLSTRDSTETSTKGLTPAQQELVRQGIKLNYKDVQLGDVISALLLSDTKLTIKIDNLEVPGIGVLNIDVKDQTFFDALVTILGETNLEIAGITIKKVTSGSGDVGIEVKITENFKASVYKSNVTAIGNIVSGLVSMLSGTIEPYYNMIMDFIANGVDVDVSDKEGYIKGGLNALFNREDPEMISFFDYVISGVNNFFKNRIGNIPVIGSLFPLAAEVNDTQVKADCLDMSAISGLFSTIEAVFSQLFGSEDAGKIFENFSNFISLNTKNVEAQVEPDASTFCIENSQIFQTLSSLFNAISSNPGFAWERLLSMLEDILPFDNSEDAAQIKAQLVEIAAKGEVNLPSELVTALSDFRLPEKTIEALRNVTFLLIAFAPVFFAGEILDSVIEFFQGILAGLGGEDEGNSQIKAACIEDASSVLGQITNIFNVPGLTQSIMLKVGEIEGKIAHFINEILENISSKSEQIA